MLRILSSMEPLTEFAPSWHIPMWSAIYPNQQNIDIMRVWIQDNEQRLIDKYSNIDVRNDGGTGLGLNSLTAQYNKFNLFQETCGIKEFEDFLKFIRVQYISFMKELNCPSRSCYLYSWANVMRPGQSVDKHNHGATHYAYLSGNMHFDNYETITRYYNPYGDVHYDFENVKGGLTFFPSYLMHGTNDHLEKKNRVSMAFDLLDKSYMYDHDTNCIDFDNA